MSRYIISGRGVEGKLSVTEEEPRTFDHGGKIHGGWPRASCYFAVKRHQLEEFTSPFTGNRMIARTMPKEMYAEHDEIRARIAAAERELESAKREEQDFLAALVPRAPRVKVAS